MAYIPALPALHTPRLTGAQAANVLTMAYAAGDDSETVALADLFADLGSRADHAQPSPAAACLSAALRGAARQTAARLS
ncbi:hypothetical protein ACIRPU_02055 [Streptomyces sp. NPDC102259]|uniref:hypothetical protein n=1 Tax=Streptomyces sp. NPDC102259 TaxID=3366148 RepID=UPI00381235C3